MMVNKNLQPAGGVCFGNLKLYLIYFSLTLFHFALCIVCLQACFCTARWQMWIFTQGQWTPPPLEELEEVASDREVCTNVLNTPELHWIKDLQTTWSPKCSLPLDSSDLSPCDLPIIYLLLTMLPCTSFPPILLQLPFSFLFLPAGLTVCVCCSLFDVGHHSWSVYCCTLCLLWFYEDVRVCLNVFQWCVAATSLNKNFNDSSGKKPLQSPRPTWSLRVCRVVGWGGLIGVSQYFDTAWSIRIKKNPQKTNLTKFARIRLPCGICGCSKRGLLFILSLITGSPSTRVSFWT